MMKRFIPFLLLLTLCFGTRAADKAILDAYISTGDNHWLGESLAIDSDKSIDDAFDMLKNLLHTRRVYWRGLQEAIMVRDFNYREQNYRYNSSRQWFSYLINDFRIEQKAAATAKKYGMEFWGIANLMDWGSTADTPGYNDYPFFGELKLREEHPEWVPVDKYSMRRQGGVIEFAYPEARKALIRIICDYVSEAGYDGVMFFTYPEDFSQRFMDEFGYNEPVVKEFKKRFGVDIIKDGFNKYASKEDWFRLRGEYVTLFLKELKDELSRKNVKLGIFLDPRNPRMPMVWACLPQVFPTAGCIYLDIDNWVKNGIVDELAVYGCSSRKIQATAAEDCIWLCRNTPVEVSVVTSGVAAPEWNSFKARGIPLISTFGKDSNYFEMTGLPEESEAALDSDDKWKVMKFLAQCAEGKSKAPAGKIIKAAEKFDNIIIRRLALLSLGLGGDQSAVPFIESSLESPETGIKCAAVAALAANHGPDSLKKIMNSLAASGGIHPLFEMVAHSINRIKPYPADELADFAVSNNCDKVRVAALRSLSSHANPKLLRTFVMALNDKNPYARFSAIEGIARTGNSEEAAMLLIRLCASDDETVAVKAATELGYMAEVKNKYAFTLRKEILDAMATLFAKLCNDSRRPDSEWAYRNVGDAFLKFGADGEKRLAGFINPTEDRALQEKAWKALNLREKAGPNEFNIITEEINEKIYSTRPEWMKSIRMEKLDEDFENSSIFNSDSEGWTRSSKGSLRWGVFSKGKSPSIEKERTLLFKTNSYIRLSGPGSALIAASPEALPLDRTHIITFKLRLEKDSRFSLELRGRGGHPLGVIETGKDSGLTMKYADVTENTLKEKLPEGKWIDFNVSISGKKLSLEVSNGAEKIAELSAVLNPSELLAGEMNLYSVLFRIPSGGRGAVDIDNVKLTQIK